MCVPAAWPVSDIGWPLVQRCLCVVDLSLAPITHRKQAPALDFTLNTQETVSPSPCACLPHASILHSSPPDPRGRLAAKTQLHSQLRTCLISLPRVQFPIYPSTPSPHIFQYLPQPPTHESPHWICFREQEPGQSSPFKKKYLRVAVPLLINCYGL